MLVRTDWPLIIEIKSLTEAARNGEAPEHGRRASEMIDTARNQAKT